MLDHNRAEVLPDAEPTFSIECEACGLVAPVGVIVLKQYEYWLCADSMECVQRMQERDEEQHAADADREAPEVILANNPDSGAASRPDAAPSLFGEGD